MEKPIKALDSSRVITAWLFSAVGFLIAVCFIIDGLTSSAKSTTIMQQIESSINLGTGMICACGAFISCVILLSLAILVREIRTQSELSRQLLRAYGHEPLV